MVAFVFAFRFTLICVELVDEFLLRMLSAGHIYLIYGMYCFVFVFYQKLTEVNSEFKQKLPRGKY